MRNCLIGAAKLCHLNAKAHGRVHLHVRHLILIVPNGGWLVHSSVMICDNICSLKIASSPSNSELRLNVQLDMIKSVAQDVCHGVLRAKIRVDQRFK